MSVLRAARTVSAPNGEQWEIYVYRVDFTWRPFALTDELGGPGGRLALLDVLLFLVELPLVFLGQVVLPAVYALVRFPFDLARARGSRVVHVEAIRFVPWRESYRWTTTVDHRDRVLEQVARGFEAGDIPPTILGAVRDGRGG